MWVTGAVLIILGVAGLYMGLRRMGLRRVAYRRYFAQPGVFEGDGVVLVEEIANRFFLPLVMVDVDVNLPGDLRLSGYDHRRGMQRFTSRFFLPPFTQIRRSIGLDCVRRGYYQLDSVNIQNHTHPAKASLHVYPRAIDAGTSNPMENDLQATASSDRRLHRDPYSFSGVRDYRPGDPFHSINYKATAKTHAVKVNNHDFFSSRNIMIYIDFQVRTYPEPMSTDEYHALMELSLSYAADMVWKSIHDGYSVGLAANCRTLGKGNHIKHPMRRGHEHYMDILREMAQIRITDGCSFQWLVRQDIDSLWNVDIYIMTAADATPLEETIAVFQHRGNHVTILQLNEEL